MTTIMENLTWSPFPRLLVVTLLALLAVGTVPAASQVVYGKGLCGFTKSFVNYEARLWSQQVDPAMAPYAPPAFAAAMLEFTTTNFTVHVRGSTYAHNVSCVFYCLDSFMHGESQLVIRVHKSQMLSGSTDPFVCLPPDKMAEDLPQQSMEVLFPPDCGEGTFTGDENVFFEIHTQTFTKQGRKHDVEWIRNMTFVSPVDAPVPPLFGAVSRPARSGDSVAASGLDDLSGSEATLSLASGIAIVGEGSQPEEPDLAMEQDSVVEGLARRLEDSAARQLDGFNTESSGSLPPSLLPEASPSPVPLEAPPLPSPTPTPTAWIKCAYTRGDDIAYTYLDLEWNLRALDPEWGLVTPFYARNGFILTMAMVAVFAGGWLTLFWKTRTPDVPEEPDSEEESNDEEEESSSDGDTLDDSEEGSDDESGDESGDEDDETDESDDEQGGANRPLLPPGGAQKTNTRHCGKCGAQHSEGRFCASCGHPQQE